MDADDPRRDLPNLNPSAFDATISNGKAIEALAEAIRLLISCLERGGVALPNRDTVIGLVESALRVAVKEE